MIVMIYFIVILLEFYSSANQSYRLQISHIDLSRLDYELI